jgi:hypothetical protein
VDANEKNTLFHNSINFGSGLDLKQPADSG